MMSNNKTKIIAMIALNTLFGGGWCSLSRICAALTGRSFSQSHEASLLQVEFEIKDLEEYADLKRYMKTISNADMQSMLEIGNAIDILSKIYSEHLQMKQHTQGPRLMVLTDLTNNIGKELNLLKQDLEKLNRKYLLLLPSAELVLNAIRNRGRVYSSLDEVDYQIKEFMLQQGILIYC